MARDVGQPGEPGEEVRLNRVCLDHIRTNARRQCTKRADGFGIERCAFRNRFKGRTRKSGRPPSHVSVN